MPHRLRYHRQATCNNRVGMISCGYNVVKIHIDKLLAVGTLTAKSFLLFIMKNGKTGGSKIVSKK